MTMICVHTELLDLGQSNDGDRDGCQRTSDPINVGLNSVFASVTGQENTTYEWELDQANLNASRFL